MKYTQYETADEFLNRMIGIFEQTEAINGLMFGICFQLRKNVFKYGSQPLFAIVEDNSGIHLAALMTPPHKLALCAAGNASAQCIDALVHGLLEQSWHIPAVLAEKKIAEMFADAWTKYQNCRVREGMKQAVHELSTVRPIKYASGSIRQATSEDMDIAQAWGYVVEQAISDGNLFLWFDSVPVSMAAKIRPTPHGESVSFVYTPPEFRGRGYATSLVAALSQKILDSGKQFCCLYTDLANPTSNSIYRKIGYVPVAKVVDIHFDY